MRWALLQRGGLATGLRAEQSDKGFYVEAAHSAVPGPNQGMEVKSAGEQTVQDVGACVGEEDISLGPGVAAAMGDYLYIQGD